MPEQKKKTDTPGHDVLPEVPETPATQSAPPTVEEAGDHLTALTRELEEARRTAESHKDQLLRKAAEFENYKRRMETDVANLIRNANEGLLLSLLPVLDDFDRSLKHRTEEGEDTAFLNGVELIRAKLVKILEGWGLAPFESLEKPFDVEFHDALMQAESDTHPPHTVIKEVERGYLLNGKVLRHAKVIVSAATGDPPGDPPSEGAAQNEGSDE